MKVRDVSSEANGNSCRMSRCMPERFQASLQPNLAWAAFSRAELTADEAYILGTKACDKHLMPMPLECTLLCLYVCRVMLQCD